MFDTLEVEHSVLDSLDVALVEAPGSSEPELVHAVRGSDALLVCFAQISAAVVESAASGGCRVIARYGIGYDNVDVEAATRAGIVVTNVPDYCSEEVADHTIALLLALARQVAAGSVAVRNGDWSLPNRSIHRLRGRRLGLIGLGAIGRAVADRALALGLEVAAFDPYANFDELERVVRARTLEEAIADAHFVSLHLPLTAETTRIINVKTLAAMREGPILLNTARGGLVDLDAVLAALESGRLSGLGLDVTDPEPLPDDHRLRSHPLTLITPHVAFHSIEAVAELQRRAAQEVARALRGDAPECPVNEPVLE